MFFILAILLGLQGASRQTKACPAINRNVEDARFAPGQVWTYAARLSEPSSTVTILEIDSSEKLGTILHVRVDGLQMLNMQGEVVPSIEHMPFSREAMLKSVRELKQSRVPLPTLEGYDRWRSECGGVYTISIADAINVTQKALLSGHH